MKSDNSYGIVNLTNDDYNLISDRMEKFTNQWYKKMDAHHTELLRSIADLLQMLCIVVKEVRVSVKWDLYSTMSQDQVVPSKERTVETSSMTPETNVQVISQAIYLGTLNLNVVIKDLFHVTFDFSAVPMY